MHVNILSLKIKHFFVSSILIAEFNPFTFKVVVDKDLCHFAICFLSPSQLFCPSFPP